MLLLKEQKLYMTREWALLILKARSKPRPYIVSTNSFSDLYDFQNMSSITFLETLKVQVKNEMAQSKADALSKIHPIYEYHTINI